LGNIPLPALSIRPPEQPDMMANMSKLMMLKNALGQQQLQQQGLQTAQLENQQRQMDVDSTKAFQKAYMEAQGDPDKTAQLAAKYGAKPDALLSWKTAVNAQKIQAMDLVAKQGGEAKRQADLMQGAHDQIAALPAEQRQAAWPQALQQLSQQGVDISKSPANYPGDQAFQMLGFGIKSHAQQIEEALKAEETAKNKAQAAEANAATGEKQTAADWYKAHGGAPGVPVEAQQQADWLSKNKGKTASDFLVWKAQHSPSMLLQGNFGQQGDPMIDMVGQGRVDLATALQRVGPGAKDAFLKQLDAKYPGYSQATYGVEKKVEEKFTSGNVSDQLMAINTAREHMKTFRSLADALDNTDVQALNKLGNAFGVQFGSDKATNFRIAAQAFGGEVGKAFDGAGVVAGEREQAEKNFNDAMAKGQFKGAIETVDKLLAGKQKSAKETYEQNKQGKPNFGGQQSDKHSDPLGIR
jgi:hypothetical protein